MIETKVYYKNKSFYVRHPCSNEGIELTIKFLKLFVEKEEEVDMNEWGSE